jgi:DNA-binding transcriptional regulator GbsR (MarR family)
VSSTFEPSRAEALRRSFAQAWGEIGAAWGVAPSTATVQGYLLVSDGPLSEPEVRRALGMSHRAASLALAQCEEWGLIERAEVPRRSGQRGPAATAWNVVDDHWEWFRRVARARK